MATKLADLPYLDFFFRVHMKNMVYNPIEPGEDLVSRLSIASRNVRGMPEIFANMH